MHRTKIKKKTRKEGLKEVREERGKRKKGNRRKSYIGNIDNILLLNQKY